MRWQPPFSWLVPASRFPKSVEVWNLEGAVLSTLTDLPLADAVPIGGVPTGPRRHQWDRSRTATVVWADALDAGDPKASVDHRDRVMSLGAPFTGRPNEIMRTEFRFWNISWTTGGITLIRDHTYRGARPPDPMDANVAAISGGRGESPVVGSERRRPLR